MYIFSRNKQITMNIYFSLIESGKKFLVLIKTKVMETQTTTTDFMENNDQIPHMKSLSLCLNKMVLEGYDDDFKISDRKLRNEINNVLKLFYNSSSNTSENKYQFMKQMKQMPSTR